MRRAAPGDVQQAGEVAGHQLVGPGGRRVARLLLAEAARDLGEVDAEGAAEAAADVGAAPSRAAPGPRRAASAAPRALLLAAGSAACGTSRGRSTRPGAARRRGRGRAAPGTGSAQRAPGHVAGRRLLAAARRRARGSRGTTIAAQEPEGTTTGSSPANARSAWRATGRAWSGCPALQPGWPQQVCARGTPPRRPPRSQHGRAPPAATDGADHVGQARPHEQGAHRRDRSPARCYPHRAGHGPDPVSTERYRISKRAADPVDRVKNRETTELRRTLPSSLSLPKQQ